MSSGGGNDRIDVLRKGGIVAVLIAGMWLLHRFATTTGDFDPTAMLALGFVVLASYTFGELVGVVRLPHITGYLLAGLLLGESAADALAWVIGAGPEWLGASVGTGITEAIRAVVPEGAALPPPFDHGVLNHDVVDQLSLFNTLAVALIAMTAGGELKIETLRKGVRALLGVLGGQTVAIVVLMIGFALAISGMLTEAIALPFANGEGVAFGGLDLAGVLLLGAILAAISVATSPAATIAVINNTQAKGPVTSTILSTVVLKDVVVVLLFSIVTAIAAAWIDPGDVTQVMSHAADAAGGALDTVAHAAGADSHVAAAAHGAANHGVEAQTTTEFVLQLLWHIVGSLAVGVLVGLGVSLYLRFVGVEILLFLVGLVFTVAYVGTAAGLDTTLLFIAAGFAATNFSKEGDHLIHEVEKLGLPVYVVFFTLTGAGLHLETLASLLPFALALVAIRMFGIWGGIRAGTRITGAPDPVRQYSWLGFVSQAGVAIALAGLVAQRFGDTGAVMSDLIIAGVAIHEVIGPVMLKVGLGLSREIASSRPDPDAESSAFVVEPSVTPDDAGLKQWEAPADVPDPWGPAPDVSSPALVSIADDVRNELKGMVLDVETGHLRDWAVEARNYIDSLRKAFLRQHRRISVAAAEGRADMTGQLRGAQMALADGWRDVVLARRADVEREQWSPSKVVDAVDAVIDGLPERTAAQYEPETLRGPGDESAWMATRRAAFRIWYSAASAIGGEAPTRPVPAQTLARYHLGGLLPGRLEGLAALLVSAERHLQKRTHSLFMTLTHDYDAVVDAVDSEQDLIPLLQTIRAEVEAEFALARAEIDHIVQDGALRTARILGESWRDFAAELASIATVDLPASSRRYSKVFNQRTKGLLVLDKGLSRNRKSAAARYDNLALELELIRLEGRVTDLVDQHGTTLARNVRGKGTTQVGRVDVALRDALTAIEAILLEDLPAPDLARILRETCDPLDHVADDAARAAAKLREQLADDQALSPLLDALLLAARDLTERYTVPVGPELEGEWKLPPATNTVDVPFREVVQAFVETTVTRDLAELTRGLAASAQQLAAALDDFDRLVAFNVELATGELDLYDGPVSDETRDLVRDMVVGNLTRARTRLQDLSASAQNWADEAERGVKAAVMGELDGLRQQIQEGRVSEVRVRLLREAAAGRRLVAGAGGIRGILTTTRERGLAFARDVLGAAGVHQAQRALGLRTEVAERRPDPMTFADVRTAAALPLVYRRLFSDAALEAADLLTGRRSELERARKVLDGELGGRLRSVAVVGPAGVGKRAMVAALARKVNTRNIERIKLTEPVTVAEVEAWFAAPQNDRLVVLEGFEWLFTMSPSGMKPLRAFARGLVRDDGRNRWLVAAPTPLWAFANRVAELADAFAEIIELEPLDANDLAQAILARHSMSGYALRFEGDPGLGWRLRQLLRPSAHPDDRPREAWFAALHASSGGLLNDGLRLWMASISAVVEDKNEVVVGEIPPTPIMAIHDLPDQDLLTLRQVGRQGVMDVPIYAWLFRTSEIAAEAHLAHLAHLGLLHRTEAGYAVADHLQGTVGRVLKERGWTE